MAKNSLFHSIRRAPYAVWALVLLVTLAIPAIKATHVRAYGLLGARSIRMSSSAVGTITGGTNAAGTTGTNVSYELNFTVATSGNLGSVVIQFCANTPIIGDSVCDVIPGFSTNHNTTVTGAGSGVTDFTVAVANSNSTKIVLTRPSANLVNAATAVTVPIGNGTTNGFTNPSSLGTFYARIMTYTSLDGTGTEVDAGGVALATTTSVDITSIVKERLTFCVYRVSSCPAGVPDNSMKLGNTQGVLDTAGPFVDNATKFDVASNAVGNVIVRIKGDTLMSGGTRDIAAIGATPAQVNSSPSVEQFGLCAFMNSGSTGMTIADMYDGTQLSTPANAACAGTSNTSGTNTYGGDNNAYFAFDNNTTNGARSTYGTQLATVQPGQTSTGTVAFMGKVADTTEAGIYRTTLNFIATGTY